MNLAGARLREISHDLHVLGYLVRSQTTTTERLQRAAIDVSVRLQHHIRLRCFASHLARLTSHRNRRGRHFARQKCVSVRAPLEITLLITAFIAGITGVGIADRLVLSAVGPHPALAQGVFCTIVTVEGLEGSYRPGVSLPDKTNVRRGHLTITCAPAD